MTTKTKTPAFTPAEVDALQMAARQTWDYIGYDAIQACGDMTRSGVLELVIDADRMREFVKDKTLADRFYALDYKDMVKMIKPAFPFNRYCM